MTWGKYYMSVYSKIFERKIFFNHNIWYTWLYKKLFTPVIQKRTKQLAPCCYTRGHAVFTFFQNISFVFVNYQFCARQFFYIFRTTYMIPMTVGDDHRLYFMRINCEILQRFTKLTEVARHSTIY